MCRLETPKGSPGLSNKDDEECWVPKADYEAPKVDCEALKEGCWALKEGIWVLKEGY